MSQTLLPIAGARFTWSKLWSILRQSPRRLTVILLLFVASSLTVITTPIVIGKVIDRAYAGELTAFPWFALGVIALAVIADALLERTWNFQSQILGTRLNQELSIKSMDAALSLNAQTIEDAGSGDLLTRVTTDIDAVRQSVTDGIPRITLVVVYLGVTTVTLFTLSPVIGLVIIPMLIAMWFLLKTFLPKIAAKVITKTQRTSELTTAVTENVRGLQTIKELDIHQERHQVFTAKNHNVYEVQQNLVTLRSTLWGLDSLSSYTPLLLTLIWGSYAVTHSWTSWGAVSSAAILVFSLRRYTDEFSFWLDRLRESTITMGRIFGIIELAEHQKTQREKDQHAIKNTATPDGAAETNTTDTLINVHNVSFGYTPENPIMHHINFTMKPGESVALIGRSGSGKTTLARLISGSLTANTGIITIMGQPIGHGTFPTEPAPDGRPKLLICTQEAHQFVGTVADNMTVAKPNATENDINQALHAVNATWTNQLPQGIHTLIGKDQHELTRDQVQQLALARIVLANPHAVILDESTTQLELTDATTSLSAVFDNRAVLIISHDARIAALADRFVHLHDGRIVEDTPERLAESAS